MKEPTMKVRTLLTTKSMKQARKTNYKKYAEALINLMQLFSKAQK